MRKLLARALRRGAYRLDPAGDALTYTRDGGYTAGRSLRVTIVGGTRGTMARY